MQSAAPLLVAGDRQGLPTLVRALRCRAVCRFPVSEPAISRHRNAASALCPSDRDQFATAVHRELADQPQPIGDGAVARAIAGAFRILFHPPEEAARPPSRWNRSG